MNALDNGLRDRANAHVVRLQNARPDCAASVYVSPMDTEETIDALAAQDGVRALKCYCYSAGQADVTQLPVGAFLTEAMWRAANGRGLAIVLHLMRTNALSDQGNFAYVTRMARKYPNAQLVLAHCAAGFAGWTLLEKIRELEDAGNIWFDLAAVCESAPMMACILKNAGKRAMWGSDYPICMHRGRSIALAGRETWLMDDAVSRLEKTYIGIENLTALYHASLVMNLDATQVQDLFYGNAARLFGVIAEKRIS